jgi:hypothetical protein
MAKEKPRDLAPRRLSALSWRRRLNRGARFNGFELGEGCAQKVDAWGAGEAIFFDGAADSCGDGGEFGVSEIDCRHRPAASQPLSSKTFDPALHGGAIAVRHVHHPDHY